MKELIQLKNKDLIKIREDILEEQKFCCAICAEKITQKTGIALDHQHRTKSSLIGQEGGGLIRGVICRSCNVLEGRIWNAMKRYGKDSNRSEWLKSLIQYLDKENYPFIHPSEAVKPKKIKKNSFKKMIRLFKEKYPKKKLLEYPKSGKLTKKINKLFKEFEIKDFYLK